MGKCVKPESTYFTYHDSCRKIRYMCENCLDELKREQRWKKRMAKWEKQEQERIGFETLLQTKL